MEPHPTFIHPSAYDVTLSDLNHEILMNDVSKCLNVNYLCDPTLSDDDATTTKVEGVLWGLNLRPLVNLMVMSDKHKKPQNLIFLVDTACPHLYIGEKALIALGYIDYIPSQFHILFQGIKYGASMSPHLMPDGQKGHFRDINILGASFLRHSRSNLVCDYMNMTCSISFN